MKRVATKIFMFLIAACIIIVYASCDADDGPTRIQGRLAFTVNPDSTTNGFIRVSGHSFNFPTDNTVSNENFDLSPLGTFDFVIPANEEVQYYDLAIWTSGSRAENIYGSEDSRLVCHEINCARIDPGKSYRDVILEVDTR